MELLKESIKNGNTFILDKTDGASMWPLISTGDIVHIKYKNFKDLKVGDIILYQTDKFILHRINKIADKKLFTKGDNNKCIDSKIVTESNYFGILNKIENRKFNIILNKKILKKYYQIFKILGYNIKYLNFLRKLWLKGKSWKE